VKDTQFIEEREYRYIFHSKGNLPNPYIFEIESLEDISRIIPISQFLKSYHITVDYN